MKTCCQCGKQAEDYVNFCTACGSSTFSSAAVPGAGQAIPNLNDSVQESWSIGDKMDATLQTINSNAESGNGNIIAGVVGAFLLSLIGGLLYFAIYQAGIIAGLCGVVIFVLANFGYGLFAKTKDTGSAVALIVSAIITLIMIFISLYVSCAFAIMQEANKAGYSVTLFDSIRSMPNFLSDAKELKTAFIEDLVMSYIFAALATIGTVVKKSKSKKGEQK